MEGRRRTMGQNRTVTAGKYGSHPPALDRKVGATHRVDPLMETVEPPARDAGLHCPLAQAELKQLEESGDPVLLAASATMSLSSSPRCRRWCDFRTIGAVFAPSLGMGQWWPLKPHGWRNGCVETPTGR